VAWAVISALVRPQPIGPSTTTLRALTLTLVVALVTDPTLLTISEKTCGPDPLAVRTRVKLALLSLPLTVLLPLVMVKA